LQGGFKTRILWNYRGMTTNGGDMHWSEKRHLLSVRAMKLWHRNPRLVKNVPRPTREIIGEILEHDKEFGDLVRGIAVEGFQYFDMVVVVHENNRYVVIEGNRRVAALKLLLDPSLAPRTKRPTYRRLSAEVRDTHALEKIRVTIAPSVLDASAFITRRHTKPPIRKWEPLMQYHWTLDRLAECGGDISETVRVCALQGDAEVHDALVGIKLHRLAIAMTGLTDAERTAVADPYGFPITTLERAVLKHDAGKKFLGVKQQGDDLIIETSPSYFEQAFTSLVRLLVREVSPMTSRTISTNEQLDDVIRASCPVTAERGTGAFKVSMEGQIVPARGVGATPNRATGTGQPPQAEEGTKPGGPSGSAKQRRERGLIPQSLRLRSAPPRINAVFNDLKYISPSARPNTVGVMLRVLLDLAVTHYIEEKNLKNDLIAAFGTYEKARELKPRLTFLLKRIGLDDGAKRTIQKLFREEVNFVTLDTLNMFVHSLHAMPLLTKSKLDSFWQALQPLFMELLDIDVA